MLHYITLETKLSFSVVCLKFLFTYSQGFLVCSFHLVFFAFSIFTIVSLEYLAKRSFLGFALVYLLSISLENTTLGFEINTSERICYLTCLRASRDLCVFKLYKPSRLTHLTDTPYLLFACLAHLIYAPYLS